MKSIYNKYSQTILFAVIVFLFCPKIMAVNTLTIEQVRKLALENNRTYLAAKEEITKADAEVITARAGGLPHLTLTGYYNRNIKLPTFFLNPEDDDPVSFKVGFKNDFGTILSLRQSLWSGGRVINAYKIAGLYKKYANAVVAQVEKDVVAGAEKLFYSVILSRSNHEVLQKAYEANCENLEVAQKMYSQGMISEYELLRAKVEKANLEPQLIQAESEVELSKKELKSFLGLDLSEEIFTAADEVNTLFVNSLSLEELVTHALANRPELKQATIQTEMTRRAVSVMKADYYPKIMAVSDYSWTAQSDNFSLSTNNVSSWSAGIQVSFPIFSGGETKGNVKNYKAEYRQAEINMRDANEKIRLEVEQAYDKIVQAKKALEIQSETIAQAEEGQKIANLRYESGVGTQLEVLSAQSALTQARNSLALATFSFQNAVSELKRVTMFKID